MRIAITGATGNLGSSLISALSIDPGIDEIVGIARHTPPTVLPKVRWQGADVSSDDCAPLFQGADAVVHLAWAIQPSHQPNVLNRINVRGSQRVFESAARAGVKTIVYASSVGAYSPGPKNDTVDETWPTDGIASSIYSRQKSAVERLLNQCQEQNPDIRCVLMRPGLMFKREAAKGIQRLFLGRLIPTRLLLIAGVPLIPNTTSLVFQALHTADAAEAIRVVLHKNVRGAFNLAADPVLDPFTMADALDARAIRVPASLLRRAVDLSWRLRLQPTDPGWVNLALQSPLLNSGRARTELDWKPTITSTQALSELVEGLAARNRR